MSESTKALAPHRPAEERRRRFAWVDDDVLHLKIDGEDVKSSPRVDETDPSMPPRP